MNEPCYISLTFTAMGQTDKSAQLISVLAQAMDHYQEISPADRHAVAEWFYARFATHPV